MGFLKRVEETIAVIASEAKQSIAPNKTVSCWIASLRSAMTIREDLRREHRAPDQPALLQIDHRLIGLCQWHRRHRNGGHLLGADEIEQFLRLPEIAGIAALDGDCLERNQRPVP